MGYRLALIAAVLAQAPAPKPAAGPDPLCGAYCLYVALKSLDLPVGGFSDVEARLGPPSRMGYSMEDLAKGARGFGASTVGVETTLESLEHRPGRFACIALLERGHFVNVYDVRDGKVFLIDAPGSREAAADAFRTVWGGRALLLSAQPIEASYPTGPGWRTYAAIVGGLAVSVGGGASLLRWRGRSRRATVTATMILPLAVLAAGCGRDASSASVPSIPRLELDQATVDLGRVPVSPRPILSPEVAIRNTGTAPLVIEFVSPSCQCTVVEAPKRVEPGASARLKAQVAPGMRPGSSGSVVSIGTNDPVRPVVEWTIRWRAVSPITPTPDHLEFGAVWPDSPASREVAIELAPALEGKALAFEARGEGLSARWATGEEIPTGEGVHKPLIVTVDAGPGGAGPEPRRGLVVLTEPDSGSRADLAVNWRPGSGPRAEPAALFTGAASPGEEISAALTILSDEANLPEVATARGGDGQAVTVRRLERAEDGRVLSLDLARAAPQGPGSYRVPVSIYGPEDGRPLAVVPWSIVVVRREGPP